LISGPNLATGAQLLSFNKTQSRVVIGLLTGHNTLRRHLYILGLSNNPTCRKCGTEEETLVHILRELGHSLTQIYIFGFILIGPGGSKEKKLGMGAIWNFSKGTGLLELSTEYGTQRAYFQA